ncbi:MAG: hypothetical protein NTW87_07245 [Planctomycetota bacterium]|nr:hypothetical protein [Planctomycetota bacterium]
MKLITSLALVALLLALPTWAATKDEYRAASVNGLREINSFRLANGMVRNVLAGTMDKKIAVVGRGEIMFISRLLLAGRQSNDAELLELAKKIVLCCNKAAVDGYDTPQQNSLEQIGFSLRELSLAVPQLRELKLIEGIEAERADETLKRACDFLLKYKPEPGDGNIDQRYALGVASVCGMFPNDVRVAKWKAWASKPFENVLHYPYSYAKGLPGSRKRVLEKQGDRWNWVDDTTPFEHVQGPDISEDSTTYQSSTIISWMGIARLIGREAEIKTPEVQAFIDRFYQQQMPIGLLPAYGDADWNIAAAEWIGIFEWAGATFHDPKYRAAADAIFRYNKERNLPLGDLSEAVVYADESIQAAFSPRSTVLLTRIVGRGERVPDKVILRGDDKGGDSQPYVMLMASESLGHSHPYGGAIGAYGAGGAVFLSSLGYDATTTPLHQSFLVRSPQPPFINYFGDPKGTLIAKRDKDGKAQNDFIPADARELRGAEARDIGGIAYGKVVCDYQTAWHRDRAFNGHGFLHTREAVLDKATGLLCVRDTLECKGDVEAAFGPVWHLQQVLVRNEQGFLCENEFQSKINGLVSGSKPRPVWIAMRGPDGTVLNDTFWRFTARNGISEVPQEHHLTAEWRGKTTAGQKLSFLTVFVPMPEGTTTPPNNLKLSVEDGRASVKFDAFSYVFPNEK